MKFSMLYLNVGCQPFNNLLIVFKLSMAISFSGNQNIIIIFFLLNKDAHYSRNKVFRTTFTFYNFQLKGFGHDAILVTTLIP